MSHSAANPICRLATDPSDRSAWTAAVEAYGGLCWRISLRMLADREAAADAVQDCMLAVRAAAPRFQAGTDPDGAATAWVARVAVNTCHAHRRRMRPSAPLPTDIVAAPAASDEHEAVPHLRAAIAELPSSLREAVSLRYLAGLDYEAVGGSLGIEAGAARVRVHRALEALRSVLARRGFALSALAIASVLSSVAEAAVPPLPAAAASSLAAAPLPPVAAASAITTSALAWGIGSCIALAVGGIAMLRLLPERLPDQPAAIAPAAEAAMEQAWPELFPGGLSGWTVDRGTWEVHDGIVRGIASAERGARLSSAGTFADGELTCRLRISGGGPGMRGEIQVGDYSTFFTVLATGGRWTTIHLQQRGAIRTCTSDGVILPAEAGESATGPQPGSLAFYVTAGGTIEIADARQRSP